MEEYVITSNYHIIMSRSNYHVITVIGSYSSFIYDHDEVTGDRRTHTLLLSMGGYVTDISLAAPSVEWRPNHEFDPYTKYVPLDWLCIKMFTPWLYVRTSK